MQKPRYWPTAKAYRALGLEVPPEVLDADTDLRRRDVARRRSRRRST